MGALEERLWAFVSTFPGIALAAFMFYLGMKYIRSRDNSNDELHRETKEAYVASMKTMEENSKVIGECSAVLRDCKEAMVACRQAIQSP